MSSMMRSIRRNMERETFMSAQRVRCPECGAELKASVGGRYRKCEKCGKRWRVSGKKERK